MAKWKLLKDGRTRVKVVRKIGNWDVGLIKYYGNERTYLMVRGLDYGENPIIYTHKKQVGYDRPERIPQRVKDYVYNNSEKLLKLLREENDVGFKADMEALDTWHR